MHHLVFGINFQIHSVSLTSQSSRFTSSPTSQLISVIIHTLVIHHSFTFSLQAKKTKPTFSTNPFHSRFLLPTGLPHDNGTGPDLSRSSFYFVLHFIFLFIPRYRLSWLPVSFLLHVKYTLSYRIVSYSFNCPPPYGGYCVLLTHLFLHPCSRWAL